MPKTCLSGFLFRDKVVEKKRQLKVHYLLLRAQSEYFTNFKKAFVSYFFLISNCFFGGLAF